MKGNWLELELEKGIGDAISRTRFAPHSNNLLISSWDSSLRLYDVDASLLRLEAPSQAPLLDCCFQDDAVAFTAASDGRIRRYDLHLGLIDTVGSHDDIATCIGYSNETCQLITSGFDKKLLLWDIHMKKASSCLRNLDAEVDSMCVCGFNLTVAIGASVHVYDLRNFDKPVQLKEACNGTQLRCVSSVPYAEGFAVGSVDGRVALRISFSSSNDIGYVFRCHPKSKDGRHYLVSVNDIAFSPLVSGAFVTGDNEGYVTIWDAGSRKRLVELPKYPNSVASLSYNHVGQFLAVASSYTYQEANEIEEPPRVFIHKVDSFDIGSTSAGSITMSDEEHHFESKADAGASKTFPQQAGTIRKNGYIVIKNRPCKVVEVSTSKTGKHGHAKCHFVGIDIFTGKKLEDIVPSSHNCDVPHVNRTDYQLIDISEDGFVSLLTETGGTKDDLRLPTDENLLSQVTDQGKDLVVTVMSSMGEEQICALKDIGPK
ncbi:mitotic checkpoint protein BUB3.3-like [Abrus precatorius]|uniref:Mitotic checkpoint protein BUB3.3-like n=1 Tax=Abrus precatorius TaxID=3816 RepID=A0A8B8M294_ABRPR|nr:mitotic checkpoint protein BUB3.3-like [Abrus precatorius]